MEKRKNKVVRKKVNDKLRVGIFLNESVRWCFNRS